MKQYSICESSKRKPPLKMARAALSLIRVAARHLGEISEIGYEVYKNHNRGDVQEVGPDFHGAKEIFFQTKCGPLPHPSGIPVDKDASDKKENNTTPCQLRHDSSVPPDWLWHGKVAQFSLPLRILGGFDLEQHGD